MGEHDSTKEKVEKKSWWQKLAAVVKISTVLYPGASTLERLLENNAWRLVARSRDFSNNFIPPSTKNILSAGKNPPAIRIHRTDYSDVRGKTCFANRLK